MLFVYFLKWIFPTCNITTSPPSSPPRSFPLLAHTFTSMSSFYLSLINKQANKKKWTRIEQKREKEKQREIRNTYTFKHTKMTPKNTKSKTIIYSKTPVMSKENDRQSNMSQPIPLNLINILKKNPQLWVPPLMQ